MEPNELGTLLQAAMSDPFGTLGRIRERVHFKVALPPKDSDSIRHSDGMGWLTQPFRNRVL
jgi:hypothetical protein